MSQDQNPIAKPSSSIEGSMVSWEEFGDWFRGLFRDQSPTSIHWETFLHGTRKGQAQAQVQISQLIARNVELGVELEGSRRLDSTLNNQVKELQVELRSKQKEIEQLTSENNALTHRMAQGKPQGSETAFSISKWAFQEFGQGPLSNYGLRALREMVELVIELQKGDLEKAKEELSGVDICLDRLSFNLDHDRRAGVDAKMKVNRARKWKSNGDGTGSHIRVEAQTPSEFPTQVSREIEAQSPEPIVPAPKPKAQWLIEYSANGKYWGSTLDPFSSFTEAFGYLPTVMKGLKPPFFKFRLRGLGLGVGGSDSIVDPDFSSILTCSD